MQVERCRGSSGTQSAGCNHGSTERVARPAYYQQLSLWRKWRDRAKNGKENITIRSSPARKGEPLAAPQARP
jgi:hypothetical protein